MTRHSQLQSRSQSILVKYLNHHYLHLGIAQGLVLLLPIRIAALGTRRLSHVILVRNTSSTPRELPIDCDWTRTVEHHQSEEAGLQIAMESGHERSL
jgi:hypothetical protein